MCGEQSKESAMLLHNSGSIQEEQQERPRCFCCEDTIHFLKTVFLK
jgi:hypothetical protein